MSLVPLENVDQAAVLRTLNLNPADPHTQAVLLICHKYGLDPLLKHVVLIQGRPYITRDGYLHHAHESGQFDGIEIVDEGETEDCWWAKAAVYRKDMARPFTYKGRYPKRNAGNPKYGPEMAIKTAEVMALRRAFDISGLPAADEQWDTADPSVPSLSPAAAKGRLLATADGDREAAAEAWKRAEIPEGRMVSEADLARAEDELHQLPWSWSSTGSYEDPADGDKDGPDPDEPDAAPAPEPDPLPPAAEDGGGEAERHRQPPPAALNARDIAKKASLVFKARVDEAPRGSKKIVGDRLRHAVVYATTRRRTASASDLDGPELVRAWQRLDDIAEGHLRYTANPVDDDGHITFHLQAGDLTLTWTEIDNAHGEAAA